MNILLIILVIALAILLSVLLFLFLNKDKELLTLVAKYDELEKICRSEKKRYALRDDWTAMVVHELRAPLAVIKGSADLVIRSSAELSNDQKNTLLTQIETGAIEMLDLVNDLLDMAKIDSGRFGIKQQMGDLGKLLQDEVAYFTALAAEHEITFSLSLASDLPKVYFDHDRIKQVINNLLSNALKFTDPKTSVLISARQRDKRFVEINVSDVGVGVSDNLKTKLFNKFVQIDEPHNGHGRVDKGSGLGLAISKGIIEAHGGTIWIEDNKPKGAKFVFTLPLVGLS